MVGGWRREWRERKERRNTSTRLNRVNQINVQSAHRRQQIFIGCIDLMGDAGASELCKLCVRDKAINGNEFKRQRAHKRRRAICSRSVWNLCIEYCNNEYCDIVPTHKQNKGHRLNTHTHTREPPNEYIESRMHIQPHTHTHGASTKAKNQICERKFQFSCDSIIENETQKRRQR